MTLVLSLLFACIVARDPAPTNVDQPTSPGTSRTVRVCVDFADFPQGEFGVANFHDSVDQQIHPESPCADIWVNDGDVVIVHTGDEPDVLKYAVVDGAELRLTPLYAGDGTEFVGGGFVIK